MTRSVQPPARHIRQRKLLPKQPLEIIHQSDIGNDEYEELLRILETQSSYETGVEKSEENEYHLQAALANNGAKVAEVPAPPTEESQVNYDQLYPLIYQKPASYIRFSDTVEEATGCQYNMSSEDDVFLTAYNEKRPPQAQCSEDDFERIMEVFENTAGTETPFAAVDNTVLGFEAMELPLKQQLEPKILVFAKDVFEHWRSRRRELGNRGLAPSLKFETHQETDDGDPYVCFRRRDVRQTRKTRARDVQSHEKLKKLRRELEDGRQLVAMSLQRELCKRELLLVDRAIFEQRGRVKEAKNRLGIKGEDEDLINQKPQKRKAPDSTPTSRPTGPVRPTVRPDGRPLDADLTLLSDMLAHKEHMLRLEIEQKVQQHRYWNKNHVDLTKAPLSPVRDDTFKSHFRAAKAQYLVTPPSSDASDQAGAEDLPDEQPMRKRVRYPTPDEDDEPQNVPSYRRRVGRLNRMWIDRRGMGPPIDNRDERWKYDQDSDDEGEQPVYLLDPYEPFAMRFRSTIPLPQHIFRRPMPIEASAANGQSGIPPASSSPSNHGALQKQITT